MVDHKEIIPLIPREIGEGTMSLEEKESSYEIIKNHINKEVSVQMPIDLLKTNGYIKLGNVISAEETRQNLLQYPIYNAHVKAFSSHSPIYNYNEASLPNGIYSWDAKDLVKCDSIVNLASSPLLLSFVAQYLGCPPTFYSCNCMLSIGRSGHGTTIRHRDQDDFKFVCVFVYLDDVNKVNGPHIYECGTHKLDNDNGNPSVSVLGNIVNDSLKCNAKFPEGERITLEGKAGDGFITDSWGVHLGKPVLEGTRTCLWLRYGLYDNWTSRHDGIEEAASSLNSIKMNTPYNDYVFRFFSE